MRKEICSALSFAKKAHAAHLELLLTAQLFACFAHRHISLTGTFRSHELTLHLTACLHSCAPVYLDLMTGNNFFSLTKPSYDLIVSNSYDNPVWRIALHVSKKTMMDDHS
eukprot:scaffold297005_cov21-Tisochrysis_lutea.AAC.1